MSARPIGFSVAFGALPFSAPSVPGGPWAPNVLPPRAVPLQLGQGEGQMFAFGAALQP